LGNQHIQGRDIDWTPLEEPGLTGIYTKTLRYDHVAGRASTFLIKFDPGASYPAHSHPGDEEVYVLEGSIRFGDTVLRAGDYLYTAPGNSHTVRSGDGCIALAVVPEEVERL
jgi:quercetin dioxygenase-like cupin family protein